MRADELFRELDLENPLALTDAAEIEAPHILALNVYRRRKALRLSQDELARRMGVKQPRIAQIERGDANIRIGTVARLAVALGCEAHELLLPVEQNVATYRISWAMDSSDSHSFSDPLGTWPLPGGRHASAANDNFAMSA